MIFINQVLKDTIYNKGTSKHVHLVAELGGMNDEERQLLDLIHKGKIDEIIESEMGLSRKSRERIEESVRAKVLLAVFECLNYTMEHKQF